MCKALVRQSLCVKISAQPLVNRIAVHFDSYSNILSEKSVSKVTFVHFRTTSLLCKGSSERYATLRNFIMIFSLSISSNFHTFRASSRSLFKSVTLDVNKPKLLMESKLREASKLPISSKEN